MAELIGALSLAADVGSGHPMGQGWGAAIVAARLAEAANLTSDDCVAAYYLAELKYIGCTTESHTIAEVFGDEIEVGAWFPQLDMGKPMDVLSGIARNLGAGRPTATRSAMIARALVGLPKVAKIAVAHCETATRLSPRLSLPVTVRESIVQLAERWDGRGLPRGLRGEQVSVAARVASLARDAAVFNRLGGPPAVEKMARERSGGAHDPALVVCLLKGGAAVFDGVADAVWAEVLAAEPGQIPRLSQPALDEGLEAIADFVDLKFPGMAGHSRAVACLASAAGALAGLNEAECCELRRAGLVHDIGRIGISSGIWHKPGRLSQDEWEKVRLHPYLTERILAQPRWLERLGSLASLHHERLDGSGYHHRALASHLSFPARLLAAADAYEAMLEPRSHREARLPENAAEELRAAGRAGKLDPDAVASVTAAAGHRASPRRRAWPMDLTDREVDVLRSLARGWSDREIASRLHISRKTVGHHIEHIYDKIEVSTRSAATLFAMEHDLIRPQV